MRIGIFTAGLLVGVILTAVIGWNVMPSMMLEVRESNFSLDDTVAKIEASAIANGWLVPKVYDIQSSLHKAGHEDMTGLKILSMCQPDHAFNILSDDANKLVSAMMPCRIGVFETSDGKVMVSQMNIGLMSRMFGGTIEEVMGKVADEEEVMLTGIVN